MLIYYLLYFLLSFVSSISNNSYCTITDGQVLVKKYDIFFNNEEKSKEDFIIEGKLCRIKKIEEIFNCLEYQQFYNRKWILMIDNIDVYQDLIEWEKNNWELILNSFIAHITPDLIKEEAKILNKFSIRLFYISIEDYILLREYDISNESSNYFLTIYCNSIFLYR